MRRRTTAARPLRFLKARARLRKRPRRVTYWPRCTLGGSTFQRSITIDRALERLGPAEPDSRGRLLSLRATGMSAAGDIAGAARRREELGATEDFSMVSFSFEWKLKLTIEKSSVA